MKIKSLLTYGLLAMMGLSGAVSAEPPEGKGWKSQVPARDINTNRQTDDDSLRGLERAEEREELKELKEEFKQKKEKMKSSDDYGFDEEREDKIKQQKEKFKLEKEKIRKRYGDEDGQKKSRELKKEKRNDESGKGKKQRSWWKFWSSEEPGAE
ncbi:MAG: hypothetical protein ACU826_04170 [Gammaproteobacteria bacterium]